MQLQGKGRAGYTGHKIKFDGHQNGLRNSLSEFAANCNDQDPHGKTVLKGKQWLAATYPDPLPAEETEGIAEEDGSMERDIKVGLIIGGGVVLVGTLVEDFLTAGAGIADDPATIMLGLGLMGRGIGAIP